MQLEASEQILTDVPQFKGQDLKTQELRERGLLFCVGIAMPILILILWEVTTRQGWIDELFLPSISGIVTEFFAIANKGYAGTPLSSHVLASQIGIAHV